MASAASGEAFELEAKRWDDGSWHPCRVSLSLNNATYGISLNYGSCNVEDIISSREDMIGHLRFRSDPLQDGDCSHLKEGEKVLAMYNVQSRSSYFDAVIEKAYRVRHSGRLQCRCTFQITWLTAKLKGITMTIPSKSIMKLSDKKIDSHPVIAAFLAAFRPLNDVKVPLFLSSLEESIYEANLHGDLEKQVEEISKLADRSECSKDVLLIFKQAISDGQKIITSDATPLKNQGDSRRITRSQTKEHANVELVKHFDNVPLLSPLAARAALASLMHGQLLDKRESSIFRLQGGRLDLPLKDEEKDGYEQYLEVESIIVQSDACSMNDVVQLPNLAQESTNDRLVEDWDLSCSVTSRRDAKKSLSEESPYSVTLHKKPARASKESENEILGSSNTVNHSTELATRETLNGRVSTRLTRSAVHKQILESTVEGSSNEKFTSPISTKLTHSGQQIVRKIINIDQEFGDNNQIKEIEDLGTPEKNVSKKRELVSASTETSTGRTMERKKRTRKFSVDFTEEDQDVISQDGESSLAKKKQVSSKKPILRFSPRLRFLPRTRSQS